MDLYSTVFGAVGHYGSVRAASKALGVSKTTVNDYLQGRVKLSNKSEIAIRQAYQKLSTRERGQLNAAQGLLERINQRQKSEILKSRNPEKKRVAYDKYVKTVQKLRRRWRADEIDEEDFEESLNWANYRLTNEL